MSTLDVTTIPPSRLGSSQAKRSSQLTSLKNPWIPLSIPGKKSINITSRGIFALASRNFSIYQISRSSIDNPFVLEPFSTRTRPVVSNWAIQIHPGYTVYTARALGSGRLHRRVARIDSVTLICKLGCQSVRWRERAQWISFGFSYPSVSIVG